MGGPSYGAYQCSCLWVEVTATSSDETVPWSPILHLGLCLVVKAEPVNDEVVCTP